MGQEYLGGARRGQLLGGEFRARRAGLLAGRLAQAGVGLHVGIASPGPPVR